MIEVIIPGREPLRLQHLVSDVNGTLALDGNLIDGITKRLATLRDRLNIHLLTADTHNRQSAIDQQLDLVAAYVKPGNEPQQKAKFVRNLGAETVVAIGQGANDVAMLKAAVIGIGILSPEGIASEAILAADLLVPDIFSALALFEKPLRIVATLRK